MSEQESFFADNSPALESLQEALYGLWDRMKKAVERIQNLTRENTMLKERNAELEAALEELQLHVENKSSRISELEAQGGGSGVESGERVFYLSDEEREQLEKRIDELLRKIEGHLQ